MDPHLPPAPKIDGEAMLEVFVHRSMKFSGAPLNGDSPYGDGQRLQVLGDKVLEAAYTDVLFYKRPMLKADELKVCCATRYASSDTCSLHAPRSNRSKLSYRRTWSPGFLGIDGGIRFVIPRP